MEQRTKGNAQKENVCKPVILALGVLRETNLYTETYKYGHEMLKHLPMMLHHLPLLKYPLKHIVDPPRHPRRRTTTRSIQ